MYIRWIDLCGSDAVCRYHYCNNHIIIYCDWPMMC